MGEPLLMVLNREERGSSACKPQATWNEIPKFSILTTGCSERHFLKGHRIFGANGVASKAALRCCAFSFLKISKDLMVIIFLLFLGSYLLVEPAIADPVPEAQSRLEKYQGLESTVRKVVFNNPKGRIHAHDASRIDIKVDDKKGRATVVFVMPRSFKVHQNRTVECVRKDLKWYCKEK